MRKLIFVSLVIAIGIALGACSEKTSTESAGTQAGPTTTPGTDTSTETDHAQVTPPATPTSAPAADVPTPVSGQPSAQPFAIDAIRESLADQLNLALEQITLVSWQAVTWRDSCLGVHKAKEMCLTVITPGFSLVFQAGANTAVVNTDTTGRNFRLAQKNESPGPLPALSWTRTGGFAGVCQILNVYSMGTYWLRDCKSDEIVAQGVLSEGQQTYLNQLFERFGSFEWKPIPPAGSADMFIDQIRFYGTGSQAMSADEQQKLNDYLAKLAGELASTK